MSVGVSLGTAALIGGIASAGGAVASSAIGAHAAGSAADKQAQAGQSALDFQKQMWETQQQNQAPWLEAGKTSLSKLMEGLSNGTFGPGSIAPFTAPTAEQARATPGYQFTQQEGNRGVMAAASAGGRSLSGGTLKAIDRYNTGLADTTYGDTFNRALQSYQAQLAGQGQAYNQLAGVANTGQTAVQSLNNTGTQTATNVGNLMTGIGNAQASGIIGGANAISGGISGATNGLSSALLLSQLGLGATGGGLNTWKDASGAVNYSPPMMGNGPMIATPPFVDAAETSG